MQNKFVHIPISPYYKKKKDENEVHVGWFVTFTQIKADNNYYRPQEVPTWRLLSQGTNVADYNSICSQ